MNAEDLYFKEVEKYKILTREEEYKLFKNYHNGDIKSRELLINSNQRLVINIALMYANDKDELLVLIQEGNLGLIKAIDTFDEEFGTKLSTYATPNISNSIVNYLNYNNLIKVTKGTKKLYKKMNNIINSYRNCNKNISLLELSSLMKMTINQLDNLRKSKVTFKDIYAVSDEMEECNLFETLKDENENDPADNVIRQYEKKSLHKLLLENLTGDEHFIISKHYGLDDDICLNYSQISKLLSLDYHKVIAIENAALRKMRNPKNDQIKQLKLIKDSIK